MRDLIAVIVVVAGAALSCYVLSSAWLRLCDLMEKRG